MQGNIVSRTGVYRVGSTSCVLDTFEDANQLIIIFAADCVHKFYDLGNRLWMHINDHLSFTESTTCVVYAYGRDWCRWGESLFPQHHVFAY
jgi:hypothetical protein